MTIESGRYILTSIGQMHLRVEGVGPLLVFLHWSPWDLRQYENILPLAARAGYAAMAVDMAGSGQSAFKPMDMAGHAQILGEVIDRLDAPLAGIVGGHVGSGIAAEYAIANPDRCQRLILDGPATLSPEDTAKLFATMAATGPAYPLAGNERTYFVDQAMCILRIWDPHFEIDDETRPLFRRVLACCALQTPEVRQAYPLSTYRMRERAPLLNAPVLVLTAETDVLMPGARWAAETIPDAKMHVYSGAHPLLHPSRAAEYVTPILAFLSGDRI